MTFNRDSSNAVDLVIKDGGSSAAPVVWDGDHDSIIDKGPRNRVVPVDGPDVFVGRASSNEVDEAFVFDRREGVPGTRESAEFSPDIPNRIVHGHRIIAQSSEAEDLVVIHSCSKVGSGGGHVTPCEPLARGGMEKLEFGGEDLFAIFHLDSSKTCDVVSEADSCRSATRGGHLDHVLPILGGRVVDFEVLVDDVLSGSSEAVEDVSVGDQGQKATIAADGGLDRPRVS